MTHKTLSRLFLSVIFLLALSFTACNSGSSDSKKSDDTTSTDSLAADTADADSTYELDNEANNSDLKQEAQPEKGIYNDFFAATMSDSPDKVLVLDLTGDGLSDIPGIENCSNIEVLILKDNGIEKSPAGIEKLTKLKTLNLVGNPIVDKPDKLDELKSKLPQGAEVITQE